MVCPDCMYGYCIGVNCDKAIEAFKAVSAAYPNLKGVFDKYHQEPASNSEKQTGTSSSPSVATADRPALEECV